MHWQNRLSSPSEGNKKCHLVHIVDWIAGYKDKEILDKGTMIARTLRKAITGEKMQFPHIKENFADMEFQKDVKHDKQMIDHRSALRKLRIAKDTLICIDMITV